MGLFNKNNKDDEYLEVLQQISDNLRYINENNFDIVISSLESKIVEFKHNNDNEIEALIKDFDSLKKGTDNYTKTIGNICNRLDEQDKIIKNLTRDADENYRLITNQEKQIKKLTSIVTKQMDLIQELTLKDEKVKIKKPNSPVIEEYGRKWKPRGQLHLENIKGLNKNGEFITKTRKLTWNINTLLRLNKCMKQNEKYPSSSTLAKAVGLNSTNVIELGYYILNGDFDKYFNEW